MKLKNTLMVNVYLHHGTQNIKEYKTIQNKFKNNLIIKTGGIKPSVIEKCHSCFTMGSTGIIDFYLCKIKCAVIVDPKIKNPLLIPGILNFGFPLINNDDKLFKFITKKSYSIKNITKFNSNKIANFKPNWNSIEKTANWITSIVESR